MLGVLCASCIANEFSTSANPRYASGFDLSMKLRFLLCCAAVAPPPGADRLSVVKDGICGAFGCCLGDPELLDAKADRECRCLRPCVGALRLCWCMFASSNDPCFVSAIPGGRIEGSASRNASKLK